jgi:GAF domain-containing protein
MKGIYMTNYDILLKQASELLESEPWAVSAMSNISSLIMQSLADLNWAGFYLVRNGVLTVGPFQGKPACIHIQPGKGVCGTALQKDETILVPDVHAFPGHIACDSASNSEIVVPIHSEGKLVAVLDIDSPIKNRFSESDKTGLEKLVRLLEEKLVW